MIVPAVMFIESALDSLKARAPEQIARQLKEFRSFGLDRMEATMQTCGFRPAASYEAHSLSSELLEIDAMSAGYLLGIETARVLLRTLPEAVNHDVEI